MMDVVKNAHILPFSVLVFLFVLGACKAGVAKIFTPLHVCKRPFHGSTSKYSAWRLSRHRPGIKFACLFFLCTVLQSAAITLMAPPEAFQQQVTAPRDDIPPRTTRNQRASSPFPPHLASFLVVCTVDGNIWVLDSNTGEMRSVFSSGIPLVGASSSLDGTSNRRIVPGLDGQLYLDDPSLEFLQPLTITVLDVLQNPVKTCSQREDDQRRDCGIVTATKATSLFALDAYSGGLVWYQRPNGDTLVVSQSGSRPPSTVLLQREDVLVRQLSTDSGDQVWNVTLGTLQALEFGGEQVPNRDEDVSDTSLPDAAVTNFDDDENLDSSSTSLMAERRRDSHTGSSGHNKPDHQVMIQDVDSLPFVVFGTDGKSLTAVDSREYNDNASLDHRQSLWIHEFDSVVASVFGLSGSEWKPLTVLDDVADDGDDDHSDDDTLAMSNDNRAGVPSSSKLLNQREIAQREFLRSLADGAGNDAISFYRPPSFREDVEGQWLFSKWKERLGQLLVDQDYRMCFLYGTCNDGHPPPVLQSNHGIVSHFEGPQLLALPSPDARPSIAFGKTPQGLFLTWDMVVLLVCIAVCFVGGVLISFRRFRIRQRRREIGRQLIPLSPAKRAKSDAQLRQIAFLEPQAAFSAPGEAGVRKNLLRSRSLPIESIAADDGDLIPTNPGNETPSLVPATANATRTQNMSVTNISQDGVNLPLLTQGQEFGSQQQVGQIDGIPLVRYSRYDSEFNELVPLGKGGFGTVTKCKNVLDGREYAVKKVFIRYNPAKESPADFSQRLQRVLREVRVLASLDHTNIVRYYTAWLELDQSEPADKDSHVVASSDYYLHSASATETKGKMETSRVPANRKPFPRRTLMDSISPSISYGNEDSLILNHSVHSGNSIVLEEYGFTFEDSNASESKRSSQNSSRGGAAARGTLSSHGDLHSSICEEKKDSITSHARQESVEPMDSTLHPTTATSHSAGQIVRHTLYIQMQLCSQRTLADFLGDEELRRRSVRSWRADIPFALRLFLQICQGVQYVHQQGLIHRDLKPNNCFMDDSGVVKVGDFGLSRETSDQQNDTAPLAEDSNDASGGQEITAGVGTRSYASPEQMNGSDYNSATDIYSLGIILFELCYPMYTGMERYIVLTDLRRLEFPGDWNDQVKPKYPAIHGLLVSMLSTKPSDRPSAEAVISQIKAVLEQFTITSLDKEHKGSVLLRVEAKPIDDVLRSTIDLIHEAAKPRCVRILQYGLKSGTEKSVMEFALEVANDDDDDKSDSADFGERVVAELGRSDGILIARQVSGRGH